MAEQSLSEFPRAAQQTSRNWRLKTTAVCSVQSGGRKSEIAVSTGLFPSGGSEASLLEGMVAASNPQCPWLVEA